MTTTALRIDPRLDAPLFQQIFDQIADRVRAGVFPAGHRLPPTRELAEALGTTRNTVVRAYEELAIAGFIHSTVGRGSFVAALARSAAGDGPVPATSMPWPSLVSRAAQAESFGRAERLAGSAAPADLVDMARMQPSEDLLPVAAMRRCVEHVIKKSGAAALAYGPREGVGRLRRAIAEDLARQGVPAGAEDVLVTTGSQQGLDLVVRTLVNPGDVVLADSSTYAGALNLLAAAGARVVAVTTDDEGPALADLERAARLSPKALYTMPNSHNPTGACISAARREALVEWSRRCGVPLIEDDYAADLNLDGEPPPPPMRALAADVIYIGTFSKRLAPGLRIGFVVCPVHLAPRLLPLKHAMDLGSSPLLQHALAEFLERGYLRAHLARTLPEYRRRRDALERELGAHLPRGTRWHHPRHGVQLWLPLPAGTSPEAVFHEALRRGVRTSPGTLHSTDDRLQPGVRFTFCAEPADRIARGARRFAQALAAVVEPRRGKTGTAGASPLGPT